MLLVYKLFTKTNDVAVKFLLRLLQMVLYASINYSDAVRRSLMADVGEMPYTHLDE